MSIIDTCEDYARQVAADAAFVPDPKSRLYKLKPMAGGDKCGGMPMPPHLKKRHKLVEEKIVKKAAEEALKLRHDRSDALGDAKV